MLQITFFSVLKSNLKCAFCKNKNCPVRYMPERKKVYIHNGTRYVKLCEKDKLKKEKELLK